MAIVAAATTLQVGIAIHIMAAGIIQQVMAGIIPALVVAVLIRADTTRIQRPMILTVDTNNFYNGAEPFSRQGFASLLSIKINLMKKIIIMAMMLCSLSVYGKRKCCSEGYCSGGANCTACTTCGYCGHCNRGGTCSVCRPELYDGKARIKAKKKAPVKTKKVQPKKVTPKEN